MIIPENIIERKIGLIRILSNLVTEIMLANQSGLKYSEK
jgi:hypothetical protein